MEPINVEKFGQFIAALRREKGLTQKGLGERLFVSDKTVSKWERGLSMPSVELLLPLAETLGVTVTELLKGERMQAEMLPVAGAVSRRTRAAPEGTKPLGETLYRLYTGCRGRAVRACGAWVRL